MGFRDTWNKFTDVGFFDAWKKWDDAPWMKWAQRIAYLIAIVSWILALSAVFANAQNATLIVPDGDADAIAVGGFPADWYRENQFRASVQDSTPCAANVGNYYKLQRNYGLTSVKVDVPSGYHSIDYTVSAPFTLSNPTTSTHGSVSVYVRGYDDADVEVGSQAEVVAGPGSDNWTRIGNTSGTATFAAPIGTEKIAVQFVASGTDMCMDELGPLEIYTQSTCTGDCGGGVGDAIIDYTTDMLGGLDFTNFDTVQGGLQDFACESLNPTNLAGSLTGGSGGGGLGALIKMVIQIATSQLVTALETMVTNCELRAANEIAQEQRDAVTVIGPLPDFPTTSDNIWDYTTPYTAEDMVEDEVFPLLEGSNGDNVVTATARTNRILVANARAQARMMDRLVGPPNQRPWTQSGGPLIQQGDINPADGVAFAEGDYGGTAESLRGFAQDAEPDWEEIVDLQDVPEETGPGGCVGLVAERPVSEGTDGAWEQLKWNAAQGLAGTDMGEFICSILDQPPRNVTELCLAPPGGFAVAAAQGNPNFGRICFYGPEAADYMTDAVNLIPLIMLMMAAISGTKLFIG